MTLSEPVIAFGAFGLAGLGYAAFQLRTGKSLQWLFGRQVSRDHLRWLYWGNVEGSALAGIVALAFAIWMAVAEHPSPRDPSAPVVRGEDIVVHGQAAAQPVADRGGVK